MYEFSQHENETIGGLATRMRVVGVVILMAGVLIGVASLFGLLPTVMDLPALPQGAPPEVVDAFARYVTEIEAHQSNVHFASLAGLVQSLILITLGFHARRAAGGFQAVVDTAGYDIEHLMSALENQRRLFGLLTTLIVLALLLAMAIMGATLWTRLGGTLPF